jgi:chromosome segregation ATPase
VRTLLSTSQSSVLMATSNRSPSRLREQVRAIAKELSDIAVRVELLTVELQRLWRRCQTVKRRLATVASRKEPPSRLH